MKNVKIFKCMRDELLNNNKKTISLKCHLQQLFNPSSKARMWASDVKYGMIRDWLTVSLDRCCAYHYPIAFFFFFFFF